MRLAVKLPWRVKKDAYKNNNNFKKKSFFPSTLTILHIESVGGQAQRGAAVLALEAGAVEELALRAQPLHHVHALAAEEAHVAAADVGGELLPEGALWENKRGF